MGFVLELYINIIKLYIIFVTPQNYYFYHVVIFISKTKKRTKKKRIYFNYTRDESFLNWRKNKRTKNTFNCTRCTDVARFVDYSGCIVLSRSVPLERCMYLCYVSSVYNTQRRNSLRFISDFLFLDVC